MKFLFKLYLIIITLYLFVSCDLFLSVPRGRENINDDAAQITAFTAVPSGDKSVVTMWNWKDAPNWLNLEDRIEEIKIIHSSIGYPEVNFPFAGETFTDNSRWQYEWKDLKPDRTHYFSLFAKDNKGNWYAPLKVKVKLPGTQQSSVFGFADSLQVEDIGPPYISSTTGPILIQNNAAPYSCLVIKLDIPEDIYVVSATIKTSSTEGIDTSINLRVFPVKWFWNEDTNNSECYYQLNDTGRDDYAVDDSVSALIDSTVNTINDVTEVIRKALLYNPEQIVFKVEGSGGANAIVVTGTSFISINYIAK